MNPTARKQMRTGITASERESSIKNNTRNTAIASSMILVSVVKTRPTYFHTPSLCSYDFLNYMQLAYYAHC
jgi:hypothetical protein